MSPGGRETATSGGEREDAGPGLQTETKRQYIDITHEYYCNSQWICKYKHNNDEYIS